MSKPNYNFNDFLSDCAWENNPASTLNIMVDAYSFFSGDKQGYIAFFYQPKTDKWNIKSFKKQQSKKFD